jgi:hypothetical protein
MQAVQRAARTDPLPSSGLLFGDDAWQAGQAEHGEELGQQLPLLRSHLLFGEDLLAAQAAEAIRRGDQHEAPAP